MNKIKLTNTTKRYKNELNDSTYMKKRGVTKGKITVSINNETLSKFNNYCDVNSINRSDWIEKQVMKLLEEKEVVKNGR